MQFKESARGPRIGNVSIPNFFRNHPSPLQATSASTTPGGIASAEEVLERTDRLNNSPSNHLAPIEESSNSESELPTLPSTVVFTERGHRLVFVYGWESTKIILNGVFLVASVVSILAGGGVEFDILFACPWLLWLVLCYGTLGVQNINYVIKSKRMAKELLKSLEGVTEAQRAVILHKAIGEKAGESGAISESRASLTQAHDTSAPGTSFDPREGLELDKLIQAPRAPSKRRTWSAIIDDLDDVDFRFQRTDTESNVGMQRPRPI